MSIGCIIVFLGLILSGAYQFLLVLRLIFAFNRAKQQDSSAPALDHPLPVNSSVSYPKATIILCLRGADPFLSSCLAALLQQDYPNYTLGIVVDHPDDPALSVVNQVLHQFSNHVPVHVSCLQVRHGTCSLKCSALVQAIDYLPADCEAIAFVDGDVVPSRFWLRELVAPLADPQIGLTTGNRWYPLNSSNWGSLVRYLWNSTAFVIMDWYRIPWGGSLALKLSTLRRLQLQERWQSWLTDDVPLQALLEAEKLKVHLVPSLVVMNREEVDFASVIRWASRQQLLARLYSPYWQAIFLPGLLLSLLPLLAVSCAVTVGLQGQMTQLVVLSGVLVVYFFSAAVSVQLLDRSIERVTRADKQRTMGRFSPVTTLKIMATSFVLHVILMVTNLAAHSMRQVSWRGVCYRIRSKNDIELVEYQPYVSPRSPHRQPELSLY